MGLAAAAPAAVGMFAVLVAVGVPPIRDWFWPSVNTNVAEAALVGDAARVRALVAAGAPIDAAVPVRQELGSSRQPTELSPLEAAVRRRSDSLVRMLIELGARPSSADARRLACLARTEDDEQTAELLEEAFDVPAPSCPPQEAQGQPSAAKE